MLYLAKRAGPARHGTARPAVNVPGTARPVSARIITGPCRAGPRAGASSPGTARSLHGPARGTPRHAGPLEDAGPSGAIFFFFFAIPLKTAKKGQKIRKLQNLVDYYVR